MRKDSKIIDIATFIFHQYQDNALIDEKVKLKLIEQNRLLKQRKVFHEDVFIINKHLINNYNSELKQRLLTNQYHILISLNCLSIHEMQLLQFWLTHNTDVDLEVTKQKMTAI